MSEIETIKHEYASAVGYGEANLDKLLMVTGTGQWSIVFDLGNKAVADYGDTDEVYERLIIALGVSLSHDLVDSDWTPDGQHVVSYDHAVLNRKLRLEALTLADELEVEIEKMQKTMDDLRSQHGG